MVGSNKILTVSYGTFSCTLEGFEDSFGTMKAIAEYFRDLAADDRYFGAEPPVPDVEMLGRIAEREVARRVEAKMDASGITLRTGLALPLTAAAPFAPDMVAQDMAAPAAPVAAPLAPAAAPVAAAPVAAAEATPAASQPEVPAEIAVATEPAILVEAEPAPQANADAAPSVAVSPVFTDPAQVPAQAAAAFEPAPVAAPSPMMPPVAVAPEAAAPVMMTPAMPLAPARPASAVVPMPATSPLIPAHPDADSVAAKLQRIRAVVGRGVSSQSGQDYAEDLGEVADRRAATAPAAIAEPMDSLPSLAALFATPDPVMPSVAETADIATPPDAAPATADADVAPVAMDFDVQPVVQDVVTEDAAEMAGDPAPFDMEALTAALAAPEVQDEPEAAPALVASVAAPVVAPVRARVIRMRRAEVETAAPAAPQDAAPEALVLSQDDSLTDPEEQADPADLADLVALDGPDAIVSDDAFDAALSAELDAEEAPVDLSMDQALAMLDSGTLSPDDEAELLEELAAVEREVAADPSLDTDPDADITRILAAAAAEDAAISAARTDQMMAAKDGPETDHEAQTDAAMDGDVAAALAAGSDLDATLADVMANELAFAGQDDEPAESLTAEADDSDEPALAQAELAEAEPISANAPSGRDLLDLEPDADEAGMARILQLTDAELNAPETSRRRDAIAQLKAAVAATEAARRLGEVRTEEDTDSVENAFRDDLKQVVRPRRPVGEVKPDLRSERPRPAPLKLVASQRIDVPQPRPALAPVQPVRPRRVSVAPEAGDLQADLATARRDAGSFAAFAESMGAKALPDLLEAAAAYTSFVEGEEDFSRPQLMKKVQDMTAQEFSREDGLRSFGTLLRQGLIMRTRNGRFQVNGETRFNPERRVG